MGLAGRVLRKALRDEILFMAGAISFNFLAALVPLILFLLGVAGFVLQARFADPGGVLVQLLLESLPVMRGDPDFVTTVEGYIRRIIEGRRGITLAGAFFLVWFSTRLVGTLRVVLKRVFDLSEERGIVRGKVFDVQVVVIAGALFVLNVGLTTAIGIARDFGVDLLGIEGAALGLLEQVSASAIALASIWIMFLGIYRYLPPRRTPWPTALVAATAAAAGHELLKLGFGFYVSRLADYGSAYGNLITFAVLFFWIYYGAQVFILSGELAQVWIGGEDSGRVRTA